MVAPSRAKSYLREERNNAQIHMSALQTHPPNNPHQKKATIHDRSNH